MWRLNKKDTISGMKMATEKILWGAAWALGRWDPRVETAVSRVPPPARPWGPHVPLASSPGTTPTQAGRGRFSERCWSC